jgi:hypothetical protein
MKSFIILLGEYLAEQYMYMIIKTTLSMNHIQLMSVFKIAFKITGYVAYYVILTVTWVTINIT